VNQLIIHGYAVKTLESKETRASKKTTVTHNSVFAAHRLQCRMTTPKIDIRHFVLLAIANRQSKFSNSSCGGIAQLVERQLCKLEVRGSNPLASSRRPRRREAQELLRRSFGEGGSNSLFEIRQFSKALRASRN
jgi:hypothetical protein